MDAVQVQLLYMRTAHTGQPRADAISHPMSPPRLLPLPRPTVPRAPGCAAGRSAPEPRLEPHPSCERASAISRSRACVLGIPLLEPVPPPKPIVSTTQGPRPDVGTRRRVAPFPMYTAPLRRRCAACLLTTVIAARHTGPHVSPPPAIPHSHHLGIPTPRHPTPPVARV